MTKKEKEQLKEISEKVLTVVEKLDDCCGKQRLCKDCPLDMKKQLTCCLFRSQAIYNDLILLLKEKENDRT